MGALVNSVRIFPHYMKNTLRCFSYESPKFSKPCANRLLITEGDEVSVEIAKIATENSIPTTVLSYWPSITKSLFREANVPFERVIKFDFGGGTCKELISILQTLPKETSIIHSTFRLFGPSTPPPVPSRYEGSEGYDRSAEVLVAHHRSIASEVSRCLVFLDRDLNFDSRKSSNERLFNKHYSYFLKRLTFGEKKPEEGYGCKHIIVDEEEYDGSMRERSHKASTITRESAKKIFRYTFGPFDPDEENQITDLRTFKCRTQLDRDSRHSIEDRLKEYQKLISNK